MAEFSLQSCAPDPDPWKDLLSLKASWNPVKEPSFQKYAVIMLSSCLASFSSSLLLLLLLLFQGLNNTVHHSKFSIFWAQLQSKWIPVPLFISFPFHLSAFILQSLGQAFWPLWNLPVSILLIFFPWTTFRVMVQATSLTGVLEILMVEKWHLAIDLTYSGPRLEEKAVRKGWPFNVHWHFFIHRQP